MQRVCEKWRLQVSENMLTGLIRAEWWGVLRKRAQEIAVKELRESGGLQTDHGKIQEALLREQVCWFRRPV